MYDHLGKIIDDFKKKEGLIVLKGFGLNGIGERKVDIKLLLEDKFKYFIQLQSISEKIITFDEYVALNEFILAQ